MSRKATIGGLVATLAVAPAAAQSGAAAKTAADQQQARYHISQMERMLEGAVEHGATVVREKVQAAVKAQTFIQDNAENAHVRGFRLEGYGAFFDVEVPPLQGTLMWSLKTLDQNDLGLESAIKQLKSFIDTSAADNTNVQQALKRIELQIAPAGLAVSATASAVPNARAVTGAPATVADNATPDPILTDPPEEAYRSEVTRQIQEAMLDYSVPLGIADLEWLTVAARRHDDRPLLAPADSNARTVIIRIRGGDLAEFQARHITRDEALKRMEVRVF